VVYLQEEAVVVEIVILESACKHRKISAQNVLFAFKNHRGMELIGPSKHMTAGFDQNAIALELGFIEQGNRVVIFHAMKVRKQYQHLLQEEPYGIIL
jgi:hypothetical protein